MPDFIAVGKYMINTRQITYIEFDTCPPGWGNDDAPVVFYFATTIKLEDADGDWTTADYLPVSVKNGGEALKAYLQNFGVRVSL